MLTHKGTQTLRTERLTLRRFVIEDVQPMFDTWANDERVTRYMTWAPHGSPELTRQLLEGWIAGYSKPNYYNWVMELDGHIIGSISVVHISEHSEYADIGYCMGYDYWNRGLMTEAARAVIDYLFEDVGLNRITIEHAVKNPGSGRVAQKCGLSYEGTKRQFFKAISGEFLDIAFYGLLRSEWQKQKTDSV